MPQLEVGQKSVFSFHHVDLGCQTGQRVPLPTEPTWKAIILQVFRRPMDTTPLKALWGDGMRELVGGVVGGIVP